MSVGIGGYCEKFIEDESYVIYKYYSFCLSKIHLRNEEEIFDGFITIDKNYLIEGGADENLDSERSRHVHERRKEKSLKTL